MLLTDLFANHYRPLRLRGKSLQTCRLYGCTIRAFGKWLQYPPTIDDLSDLLLGRFLEERAATRSPYTAEKERTQLVSLARFARDRGFIAVMPEVPPAPLPERVQRLAERSATSRQVSGSPRWSAFCGRQPNVSVRCLSACLETSPSRICSFVPRFERAGSATRRTGCPNALPPWCVRSQASEESLSGLKLAITCGIATLTSSPVLVLAGGGTYRSTPYAAQRRATSRVSAAMPSPCLIIPTHASRTAGTSTGV